jgi:hypothetical protein
MGRLNKKIMGIYNLWKRKKDRNSQVIKNELEDHNRKLIEKITDLVITKPDKFSANWSNGNILDASIRYVNPSLKIDILIMSESGEIIRPIRVDMTSNEKKRMIEAIKPIIKRDSQQILDYYI